MIAFSIRCGWRVSTAFAAILDLNFALYFKLRGFVLSRYPQHGHHNPSHVMNISQIWQRRWPVAYLPLPVGFDALCRTQIPLHVTLFLLGNCGN